jgi:hypothetical protein
MFKGLVALELILNRTRRDEVIHQVITISGSFYFHRLGNLMRLFNLPVSLRPIDISSSLY